MGCDAVPGSVNAVSRWGRDSLGRAGGDSDAAAAAPSSPFPPLIP